MAVTNTSTSTIASFEKYNTAKGAYTELRPNPKFIAVHSTGYVWSEDGISWNTSTDAKGTFAYINDRNQYVAVEMNAQQVSQDGITWTAYDNQWAYKNYYNNGIYAHNGKLVRLSSDNYNDAITPDGDGVIPNGTSGRAIAMSDNFVCLTGNSDSGTGRYINRITKQRGSYSAAGMSNQSWGLSYGNGYWHQTAGNRIMYKAGDDPSGTWTAGTTFAEYWLRPYYAGNGMWCASYNNYSTEFTTLYTSFNGTSWTNRSLPFSVIHDVTYGNGLWVAVGNGGGIATSTNGASWTLRASGTTGVLRRVIFG